MPFVDAKITVPVSDSQRDEIKAGLGQAVSAFGKGESWLMVGIDDKSNFKRQFTELTGLSPRQWRERHGV